MRVAGVDCGTNTICLLIADAAPDGTLTDVLRTVEVVRLGQGVDTTGQFAPEALERTFIQVDRIAQACREYGVESVRFAATSATRDAANRDVFLDGVEARLGVRPQVLTGEEEARTSFAGALSGTVLAPGETALVVDPGGGSTELIVGSSEGIESAYSMDVGCVRLTERHFHTDPPSQQAIAAARADVDQALAEASDVVNLSLPTTIIGVAGTVTTVAAHFLDLPVYDPARIHGTVMTPEQVEDATQWFLDTDRDGRLAKGYMHAGRVDVIAAGALIWQEVVRRVAQRGAERGVAVKVIVSEHNVLDGMALWAARDPQPPAVAL